MLTSWKTTVAGVGAALTVIGAALKAFFDGDPSTNVDWAVTIPALLASIGLIFARDNDKSSEEVGASPVPPATTQ